MEVQTLEKVIDDLWPLAAAASIVSVETTGRLQRGGMAVMREVIPRQMLLNRLSSSTTDYISLASVPCGSRIDSALSRNRIMSFEDRNGRKGVKSPGFLTPAPMTADLAGT